ncbi:MAG: hypothetical protein MJ240_08955 [Kiritimatiellae bacterium]|nr:hypothetical protein [Kiritimatiellia bacterium]
MATHEIKTYENTSASKAKASYLGNYLAKTTARMNEIAAGVARLSGLTEIEAEAILTGAFEEFEALERESPVRINFDGGVIRQVITGSFPSSDAPFNPQTNTLRIAFYPDDATRNCLIDATPAIVTDETSTKVRLDNVADLAMPRPYQVFHGQNQAKCTGVNLVTTDPGAEVYLENAQGVKFPCTVDAVISRQEIIVHSNELLEGGDYKFVVKSRGGDPDGPLQTVYRKVKYLQVAPTGPRIAKGYPTTDPSRVGVYVLYGGFTLEGARLTGGTVKLKFSTDGEIMQEVELISDMYAVTDTKIDLVPNAISEYIEAAHSSVKPVLTVTTPEGSASYEFTTAGE